MYPSIGEYFVARLDDKKEVIAKAKKVKKELIVGTVNAGKEDAEDLNISSKDLLCILGAKPKFGSAYGKTIEVFRKQTTTRLGKFDLYVSPKKDLIEQINVASKKVHKRLKKYGLLDFTYLVDYSVRYTKSDKMMGTYKTNKKMSDQLTLFANLGNDFTYTLTHECGHGLWFRQVPDRYKGKWVKEYSKYIEIQKVKDKELKSIMTRLVDGSFSSVTDCRKDINREGSDLEKELMKYALSYLKRNKRLSIQDLDCVMADGNYEFIKSIWPVTSVDLSHEKLCPISEYAMKNVREFFAESFTLFMEGKKLPKTTQKLMTKTLRSSTTLLENSAASDD